MQPEQQPQNSQQSPGNTPLPFPGSQYSAGYTAPEAEPERESERNKIRIWLEEETIPIMIGFLAFAIILFLFIVYRYDILGVVKKQEFSVLIVDHSRGQPLIGVKVSIRGETETTDTHGHATFPPVKVGNAVLTASRPYYNNLSTKTLVTFDNKAYHVFGMSTTGKNINLFISNRITQMPVQGAVVTSLLNSAVTDKIGHAIIALPTNQNVVGAQILATNYNPAQENIVTNINNSYSIVPTGSVYYLARTSAGVALVSSNTDGSNQKNILVAGSTANNSNVQIVASHDSTYVAVVMPDKTGTETLSVYNTATGKTTQIDQSKLTINIVGWTHDDLLVYTHVGAVVLGGSSGGSTIFTYGPKLPAKTNNYAIDLTSQGGFNAFTGFHQIYSSETLLYDDSVINSKYYVGNASSIAGTATTLTANLATSDKPFQMPNPGESLRPTTSYVAPPKIVYTSPTSLDIAFTNSTTNKVTYYTFSNGKAAASSASAIASAMANPAVSTPYILSPDGKQQLWSNVSGNTTTIYVGNVQGKDAKAIAVFNTNDYVPYGWWTDDYILLNKDAKALYIAPSSGSNNQNKVQVIAGFIP